MPAPAGKIEQLPQRPADPEVLLDTGGWKVQSRLRLLAIEPLIVRREFEKCVHASGFFRICDLAHHVRYPCRRVGEVFKQLLLVVVSQPCAQVDDQAVVHMTLSKMTQCLNNKT